MKKLYFLLFLLPYLFSAQILEQYPAYQVPYIGGYEAYYKDFHEIATEKNLQPCENKSEFYQLKLLINADKTVSFIKDHNAQNIENNKCAYDLAREVAQSQKAWNAATVDGFPKAAVASFLIFPDDLFQNYKKGYTPSFKLPIYGNYKGNGWEEFRKGIVNRIDLRRFDWNDRFDVIFEFIITKDSKLENIVMIKSSSMVEFDKQIIFGIKSTAKRWKAATVNGIPVDYKYRLKLNAVTDPL